VAAVAGLVLVGAYVTFPWWVPTDYLRGAIAADLSRKMGVAVTIDRMEVSWSRGVLIRQLRIASGRNSIHPRKVRTPSPCSAWMRSGPTIRRFACL